MHVQSSVSNSTLLWSFLIITHVKLSLFHFYTTLLIESSGENPGI